jgi:hypothetical protein
MRTEEHIKQAMREAANGIEPPVSDLVIGGLARGRHYRRRRAAAMAGGALTAAVLTTGAVLFVPDLLNDSPDVVADAVADGDNPAALDTIDSGLPKISPGNVVDTLSSLLPPGEIDVQVAETIETGASVRWEIVYDDGAGESYLYGYASVAATPEDLECPIITNGGGCEVTLLDDGSQVMQIAGEYYPNAGQEPDRLQWSTLVIRPDGFVFSIAEINAPTEKGSPVTRPEPPLSLDQMKAIVTDKAWQFEVTRETRDAVAEAERARQEQIDEMDREQAADLEAERLRQQPALEALTADLGPGWKPYDEIPGTLTSTAANAADLPEGYSPPVASRHVMGGGADYVAGICEVVGTEKGHQVDPCLERATPDGRTIQIRWSRSVADDPHVNYAGGSIGDEVNVFYVQDDGSVVQLILWIAEPVETSTPESRAVAVAWLEDQVDALIAAATVGGLEVTF